MAGATDKKGAAFGPSIAKLLGIKDKKTITPLSLGLEAVGQVMRVLIPKNSTIPITSKVMTWTTRQDNAASMVFKVFEGERAKSTQNKFLGQFVLTGIQKAPRGIPKVDVTFKLEASGLLKVTAKDRVTGKKNSTTFKSGRSSEQEIEMVVTEAEKFKDEDEMHRNKHKASLEFNRYVFQMRAAANGKGLSSTDKVKVQEAVKEAFQWLDQQDANRKYLLEVNEYEEKKKELELVWKPISDRSGSGKSGRGGGATPFGKFVNLCGRSRG